MPPLVIGGGPSGVRAAAALGDDSVLLDSSSVAGGWHHPEVPEDLGWVFVDAAGRSAVERMYGSAPPVPDVSRALSVAGRMVALPLSPAKLRLIVPPGEHLTTLGDQVRARARIWMQSFVGGGLEQRTYHDWVVQQFGSRTFHALHGPYARKRWGEPDRLNASVARVHHVDANRHRDRVALGADPAAGWKHLLGKVGRIETDQRVQSLEVEDGRVVRVLTEEGSWDVDGTLYCTRSAAEVIAWLGEAAPSSLRWEIARLPLRHRIQVVLKSYQGLGVVGAVPDEVHVIDGPLPMFRVTNPGRVPGCTLAPGCLVAHLSVGPSDSLWTLGDADLADRVSDALTEAGFPATDPTTSQVIRLRSYDAGWLGAWHPVYARVAAALSDLGIELLGRAGSYRWIDPAQELLLGLGIDRPDGPPVWELLRTICDPPVLTEDKNARLDPFVTG